MTALRSSFQLSYFTDLLQFPNLDSSWQILGILNIHPTWGIHNQCNNNQYMNNTIKRIKQLHLYMISNNINKVDTNFKSIRAQAKLVQVLTHKCHVPILITACNYHHRHHDQTKPPPAGVSRGSSTLSTTTTTPRNSYSSEESHPMSSQPHPPPSQEVACFKSTEVFSAADSLVSFCSQQMIPFGMM